MRRRNRTPESSPQESITSDNYLVQLLREEEVIEAIRMVDPQKASEMSRKLEEDLQEPWTYLNKFNKIPAEERLQAFRKLKKESEEAENIEELTQVSEDNSPQSKALVKYSPSSKYHPLRISVKNKNIIRPPSHNGEYTWSRSLYHMIQEPKYAATDKLIARDKPYDKALIHGVMKTPENQFYTHNMRKNKQALWKVPEELAYRPFDTVRAFGEDRRERPLRAAAKKIAIIVTQH